MGWSGAKRDDTRRDREGAPLTSTVMRFLPSNTSILERRSRASSLAAGKRAFHGYRAGTAGGETHGEATNDALAGDVPEEDRS